MITDEAILISKNLGKGNFSNSNLIKKIKIECLSINKN